MLDIKGSVAVITGRGSGIGESVAKYWIKNGGRVVLGDIAKAGLSWVEKEIQGMGGEIASLIGEMYRNEVINGKVYFIHGGLRLGFKGQQCKLKI